MTRLLIVGDPRPYHLGGHLVAAADTLGVTAEVADTRRSFGGPIIQRLSWRLRERRPARMGRFERELIAACLAFRPDVVLATGLAPIGRDTLDAIGRLGVARANFLTDDPWNRFHRSRWFLQAVAGYDAVFTPRRANEPELAGVGVARVCRLTFGYNPVVHFPNPKPVDPALTSDVIFIGGADADRVPLIAPLLNAGLNVAAYGGYWGCHPATAAADRGHTDLAGMRAATAAAKVSLILVRRANRDGHVMRTFEAAASCACLLVEDTADHRELFGPDGSAVIYFATADQLVARAKELVRAEPAERVRLAQAAYDVVTTGRLTYADRLETMLAAVRGGGVKR